MRFSRAAGLAAAVVILGAVTFVAATKHTPKALSQPQIWVSRPDGSKSCDGQGRPLASDRSALEGAGIPVADGKSGDDGLMHVQMCGAETGKVHRFLIPASSLEQAKKLGFQAELTPGQSESQSSEKR
jgi:hypothetical protein